jgi:hypothetical protein
MPLLLLSKPTGASGEIEAGAERRKLAKARIRHVTGIENRMVAFSFFHHAYHL